MSRRRLLVLGGSAGIAVVVALLMVFAPGLKAQAGSNYFNVEVDATCACDFQVTAWGWGAPNSAVKVDYAFTVTIGGVNYPVTGVLETRSDENGAFWVQENNVPLPGGCAGNVSFSNGTATRTVGTRVDQTTIDLQPAPPNCSGLSVTKSPKMGTFASGTQVSFTIVVANNSGGTDTNVHLHDQLPSNGGLVWLTATPSVGACSISSTNVLDCDFGTLAAGGSATVVVSSTQTTPDAACQLQPNPVALATADGGLSAQDFGSMSCTSGPLACPAGSFTFSMDAAGNLNIIFDQFPAPNDNSYGVNAVGWPNGHKFTDLVGSDHAGFQLVDPGGTVRLSFNIDYISANTSAPSGYASLGPFGGDGKILVGTLTPADISFTSSLANNLNNVNIPGLFNASHVQQFGSVNVLLNSPPTDALHQTYANSDPTLTGWDFHDTYFVTISAAKLASLGFNSSWLVQPNLVALHNSPAKPCPPAATGGSSLSVTKTTIKDKQVIVTISNTGSVDEVIQSLNLTWPVTNGKLMQVKRDGDVIYDNPDIPAPSANLTLAQLAADPNKRKIKHGQSDTLTFIFEKNASLSLSDYTGTVETTGFSLTILP